jgi:hypothetical protein
MAERTFEPGPPMTLRNMREQLLAVCKRAWAYQNFGGERSLGGGRTAIMIAIQNDTHPTMKAIHGMASAEYPAGVYIVRKLRAAALTAIIVNLTATLSDRDKCLAICARTVSLLIT